MGTAVNTPIILITHGDAGRAMVAAVEQFVGPLPDLIVAEIEVSSGGRTMNTAIDSIAGKFNGQPALYLVDLDGSTPCRLCQARGMVLTGVNLPMLMKLATCDRTLPPEELALQLQQTGQRSILVRQSGGSGVTQS